MTDGSGKGPPEIDADLSMVSAGTEALREWASDPEKAQDGARVYDFSIRWGTLMSGRLMRLEHYYRAGELTEDQERRYRELKRELGEAMPQIERLDVARPTVPLEDKRSAENLRSLKTKEARRKPEVDGGIGEPGVQKGQF